MRLALLTLTIGEEFEAIAELTHPLFIKYAHFIGADFHVIRDRNYLALPMPFEKYQIRDFISKYDRILFLDTDIVVKPMAPNIFRIVPNGYFGAYLASRHWNGHDDSIMEIQESLPALNWSKEYFNSGVMVMDKRHESIFDLDHGSFVGFYEQTQLNYNLQKLKFRFFDITYRYNHVELIKKPIKDNSSHFIHYAGPGHANGPRVNQIRNDFPELFFE